MAWLLVVPVLYVGALPLVNRVEPLVFGLPFLAVWLFGATLLTPLAVWLAARGDPVWRSGGAGPAATGNAPEPGGGGADRPDVPEDLR
ncbi:DUF3311 domain-containing protein [Pseudonocardia sediminis]|uniref:DUF3311 domain-containing protein n=1 Tax=Pseudonocardia sediminis TaxID=1397368 RepID=UPI001029E899|nr:DUF3311 domain-containing protein [Pseudonocardia sediminis]